MVAGGGIGAVVIALIAMFFGVDPGVIQQAPPGGSAPSGASPGGGSPDPTDAQGRFTDEVLTSTNEAWNAIFQRAGSEYREPTLVLYEQGTPTGCGYGQSAMGPFYCPGDQMVYIDLAFFRDMETQLGGGGDFAQAYVIAHEVGHHVQTITGVSEQVQARSARAGKEEANGLSVRQELQADCYAGLWAKHAQGKTIALEPGDVEEALNTAAAIGDDRLQRQSGGQVVPESFTHGTSEQRVRWFQRGFETGDVNACDTFSAAQL